VRVREAGAVVECSDETQARHGPHSRHRHQALADGILLGECRELRIGRRDLLVERFDRQQQPLYDSGRPSALLNAASRTRFGKVNMSPVRILSSWVRANPGRS
jgi:hypothetical protein